MGVEGAIMDYSSGVAAWQVGGVAGMAGGEDTQQLGPAKGT
jgi:hypothetical protein